jgi:hypothetical protein
MLINLLQMSFLIMSAIRQFQKLERGLISPISLKLDITTLHKRPFSALVDGPSLSFC